MEKYSKWRDPSTGVAPFLMPLSPATSDLSLPSVVKFVTVPITSALAVTRALLVMLLLLAQAILVEGILSPFMLYPPLYAVLSRACNASIARMVLLVLGIVNIPVETIRLAKTGRSPPKIAFEPRKGDIIVSNSSSYVDLLYLTFRHNATFLSPVIDPSSQKVSGWTRASLVRAIWDNATVPSNSATKGETLEEAIKNARGPAVVFPECTTSNNRALLKFPALVSASLARISPSTKIFVLTFKYSPPTRLTPTLTHPIPSTPAYLGPLPHLYSLLSSVSVQSFSVRRLHPSESPKKIEWDSGLEETLASTGRLKRLGGLGWKEKEAFLEFRKLKGR
ncbi:hypothetical protein JCM3766R1_002985 [Sporobolomyces carnicolor]